MRRFFKGNFLDLEPGFGLVPMLEVWGRRRSICVDVNVNVHEHVHDDVCVNVDESEVAAILFNYTYADDYADV